MFQDCLSLGEELWSPDSGKLVWCEWWCEWEVRAILQSTQNLCPTFPNKLLQHGARMYSQSTQAGAGMVISCPSTIFFSLFFLASSYTYSVSGEGLGHCLNRFLKCQSSWPGGYSKGQCCSPCLWFCCMSLLHPSKALSMHWDMFPWKMEHVVIWMDNLAWCRKVHESKLCLQAALPLLFANSEGLFNVHLPLAQFWKHYVI